MVIGKEQRSTNFVKGGCERNDGNDGLSMIFSTEVYVCMNEVVYEQTMYNNFHFHSMIELHDWQSAGLLFCNH